MSLFGAMFSGVTGINAQSTSMGMISDNISNVNTVGFKGNGAQFSTLVTQSVSSATFSPGGVQAKTTQRVGTQGLLQASTSATDIAVAGNGFFAVNESATPGLGDETLFTRAGSFSPDPNGNLVNTAGFFLMGWPTDADGVPTPANLSSPAGLEVIDIAGVGGTASPTTTMSIGANLPVTDAIGTSHTVSSQMFDSLGLESTLSYTFTKTANGEWDINAFPPSAGSLVTMTDAAGQVASASAHLEFTAIPSDGETVDIAGTTFEFDTGGGVTPGNTQVDITGAVSTTDVVNALKAAIDGVPLAENGRFTAFSATAGQPAALRIQQTQTGGAIALDASATSAVTQSVTGAFAVPALAAATPDLQFGGSGTPDAFNVSNVDVTMANGADPLNIALDLGTVGQADGMTQFGDTFTTAFADQNGVRFGTFTGVSIDDKGLVTAQFDNGEQQPIYQIPLTVFSNPNGLDPVTGNAYRVSDNSGAAFLNEPGSGSAGTIAASTLEGSNVDLGAEFTNMIVTQRAYTASTRIISVADEMLEEITRVAR